MMEDENERARRNNATHPNPNRNRRHERARRNNAEHPNPNQNRRQRVNFMEENDLPNRPQPFDPLTILVPATDVVLILLAVIVAISCVSSVVMGIIGYLRMKKIISEESLLGIFCKYVYFHQEFCTLWN